MIKYINGDVLESGADVILHQVNCMGVMGSGVAKQVREKYPHVYDQYHYRCSLFKDDPSCLLGQIQSIKVDKNKYVVNLFGQLDYGRAKKRYTEYYALRTGFKHVNFVFSGKSIAIPYRMGCGLGGGDWDTVYKIICEELTDCDVLIYDKELDEYYKRCERFDKE